MAPGEIGRMTSSITGRIAYSTHDHCSTATAKMVVGKNIYIHAGKVPDKEWQSPGENARACYL
jgi:hypothetical protein